MSTTQNRTVNATQLSSALRYLIKTQHPAFIWGSMGIGKSDIVASLAKEYGGKLYDLRLSQCESTDLRGMPYFDHESKLMQWAPPIDLPTQEEAAKYPIVVLFLDELNSAAPSIQAAAYQLILDRKVGTYTLPDNCFVVAAGNLDSDKGVTYRMPKPLSNRLVHFELRVDFASWNEWAINKKQNPDVIGFLNFSKDSLHTFDPKSPDHAFATPRTWEYVSDIISDNTLDSGTAMDIISGTIGEGLALKFMAHRAVSSQLPNTADVLLGKVNGLAIKDIGAQYSLITSLMFELKNNVGYKPEEAGDIDWNQMCDNVLGYIMDNMEQEIVVMGMRMGLQTMALPMDHKKMSNFKRFFDGPGKLILKSVNV